MHFSTRSYLISALLSGASAVDIDFFPQRDGYCGTYAFATCWGILSGECCTWNGNPSQGSFGSARVSGMSGLSAAGVYNGGVGGCYNNACTVGSNCLNCGSTIHGSKWATVNQAARGNPRAASAGLTQAPSSSSFGPGGKSVGAKPRNDRRSVDSTQDPPPNNGNNVGAVPNNNNVGAIPNNNNVGAVPNNNNVGAVPRGGPGGNVGATPRDPLQDLLNQLRGDPYPGYPNNGNGGYPNNGYGGYPNNGNGGYPNNGYGGYPNGGNGGYPNGGNGGYSNGGNGGYPNGGNGGYPNNGYRGNQNTGNRGYPNSDYRGSPNNANTASNSGGNVGATRNDPWREFLDKLRQSAARGWGSSKEKRAVGRTVSPNRATIGGHRFNLDLMQHEQRFEMYDAIFNQTKYEDLAKSLLDFEVEKD